MTTKILRNVSLALIFLIPFIPLYVNNSLFFPFITGKAFVFRIIVEIAFALWLLLLLRDKKYAPKFSWLSLAITIFTIAIFVADMLGMNPLRSFWSNSERMEGWVLIIHLWAYFVATTGIFGTGDEGRRMWHTFFKVTLFAASCVGAYGFLQIFGWATIHQGSSRIDASLGNSAYMAVYMLMHAFIAFYMSLTVMERAKENGTKKGGLFWIYLALGLIFSFLIFETATRGTILGLVGGIMLALGIYAVFGKSLRRGSEEVQSKKSRWISAGVIIFIILLSVILVASKNTSFVKSHETLNRLASISFNGNDGQARGFIWPMAIKGVFHAPEKTIKTIVFGVGQENFNYIFNANYNPQMWTQEQWFDRAHSVFLDWLVAGGLIGFLLYISLFIFAITAIWRKSENNSLSFSEKCVLTGLFVGYAIHCVFVFDNIASYLLFFTMLGFIHSLTATKSLRWLERADIQSENTVVVRDYIFLPIIAILFGITLYFVNIRPIQANTRLIAAMTGCSGGGTLSANLYARALDMDQYMINQEIREQLLGCANGVIGSGLSTDVKQSFYNLALKEINEQIKTSPLDARAYVIGGSFLNQVGDWQDGRSILEKANELSPHKQSLIFELATNYINSGKEKEASVLLQQAYESAPENTTAKIGYVSTLVLTGQEKKAQELFGSTPEVFLDKRVLNAYAKIKQYQKVIDSYKALIAKDPENIQLYVTLASAYVQNNQSSLAISLFESMKTKFPQAKDAIDGAIKQVREIKK